MAKKILVIDDEKHIVQIVKFNLEKKGGYIVETAMDGLEGYNLVINSKPDLIISDLMMPNLSGFELKDRLDENGFSEVPFIILTAKGQLNKNEESKKEDVIFMTKPFSPRNLLKIIKDILGE